MSDREDVLSANEAFYDAFSAGDIPAMEALWSREHAVACIHPGWAALSGRESVMESWNAILDSPNRPAIQCHAPAAYLYGWVAFVVCYEVIPDGLLVATNVFARENGGDWKLVHHQAGPTQPPYEAEGDDDEELSQTIH